MNEDTLKKTFQAGETLVAEGEMGDCAYIIEEGSVEILVQRDGQLIQIGTRGPGSLIGEMAMIDDQPRVATVKAVETCEVMEITRDEFGRRLETADPVLKMVMRVILARYREMLSRSSKTALKDSIVPGLPAAEEMERGGDTHDRAVNEIKVYNELRHALKNEELLLNFQPIIDLATGKIAGFESLMRWNHPEKGVISPGIFIPVAEETGLIVELTQWAFSEACSAIKLLQGAANPDVTAGKDLFVSVNFSVKDFADDGFFKHIDKTLKKKSVPADNIHLEITETLLMEQPSIAQESLQKCKDRGLTVAIDDFGSGYSSLSYLHFFPIDVLKIDQSFIRSMLAQETSYVLIKSIIGLAKNLNMHVVAEGIETKEEAEAVKALNCELCQGFWFAKPQPLAQAINLVKDWQPADI